MASKANKRPPKIEYRGFLRCNLSKEQVEQFKAWYETRPDVWSVLEEVIDEGYKLSIAEDTFNDAYQASLYCNTKKLDWAGWTLQAFAGTADKALALLFFKHWFVLDKNWEAIIERPEKGHQEFG